MPSRVGQIGLGLQLFVLVLVVDERGMQKAGHAAKLAVDLVLSDDRFDGVDRGCAGLKDEPGRRFAKVFDKLGEPQVGDGRQMGGRVAGIAIADPVALDDADRFARLLEKVSGREPGDSAADDDDVELSILFQSGISRVCEAFANRIGS